jgi:hypothetical protein
MWPIRTKPAAPPSAVHVEYVTCRDVNGHRSALAVSLTGHGQIALTTPHGDVAVFELLQAAPLRASLRTLALTPRVKEGS